jgi:Icc-related predicted phosphoesterase
MRIVHFSDWHWRFRSVPEADLYVCTGDMYDNYPVPLRVGHRTRKDGSHANWTIDPLREVELQAADARVFVRDGGFRRWLSSPDAPIVCVRGNHDFADLAPLFEGCNLVHEFVENELVEVLGLRVTGHRGIPWIYGSWNDEMSRDALMFRVNTMPRADLFLTHYPPADMLDYEINCGRIARYGLEGMQHALEARMGTRGVHCFGHIHGCGGVVKETGPGSVIGGEGHLHVFSNAACHVNVIEV